jgi:hypothetical protein
MASFVPCQTVGRSDYDNGISLTELFNIYSAGMVLGRDNLCVQKTQADIEKVLYDMQTKDPEQLRQQYSLGKDTDWNIKNAINDIEGQDGEITQIAYRPFDNRWTYYSGRPNGFYCRPRGEVMQNFIGDENVGFIFARGDTTQYPFSMIFITDKITEARITVAQTAGICSVAPLFIKNNDLIDEFIPNFNPKQLDKLTANLTNKPTSQVNILLCKKLKTKKDTQNNLQFVLRFLVLCTFPLQS